MEFIITYILSVQNLSTAFILCLKVAECTDIESISGSSVCKVPDSPNISPLVSAKPSPMSRKYSRPNIWATMTLMECRTFVGCSKFLLA